jgi:acetyl esterase/lipase
MCGELLLPDSKAGPFPVDGGGWPGAFLDLGKAVDLLPKLSREHPPDLSRIVLVGHSSGERCAAWLAVDFYRMVLADTYMDALVIDSKGVDLPQESSSVPRSLVRRRDLPSDRQRAHFQLGRHAAA